MRISATLLMALAACSIHAAVDHFDVTSRTVALGGQEFGAAGSFEKISGRVYFKVKPGDPHNRVIVDLGEAPADASGDVEFSADFYLLRPVAMEKSNGALLLEIPNRGGKAIQWLVDGGAHSWDPSSKRDFGDGWLLRQGYTLGWLGWQWDMTTLPGAMRLYAPIAYTEGGKHIRGLLRDDFTLSEKKYDLPLGHIITGTLGGAEYPVSDPKDSRNVLTVRDSPAGVRQTILRSEWTFGPDARRIHLISGFEPGKIYELVYAVQDPVVAGLGLAAVRDFVSYLKYDRNGITTVARAYAAGASQSGRFLRQFLYQDFNADEYGRKVLDGVIVDVAGGGRGSFNLRFAQPSRDASPMSAIFYPTDLFPFTDLPERDPLTGETAGLLDGTSAADVTPKIFYVNTSYEYWSRSASLIHTSPDGMVDAKIAANTRVYLLAGQQHFAAQFPPVYGAYGIKELEGQNRTNPNPDQWLWRAIVENMNSWVKDGIEPPPSRYPHISDGTLVPLSRLAFPNIPTVKLPTEVSPAWRLDFGPEWKLGIMDYQPPIVGSTFPTLVPQVDADGNELAGVHIPELTVPLATYTGWNLRNPAIGAPDRRVAFIGSYLPFALTAADRQKSDDSRLSINERYVDEDDYLTRYRRAAEQLIKERWLLQEDLPAVMDRAKLEWQAAHL